MSQEKPAATLHTIDPTSPEPASPPAPPPPLPVAPANVVVSTEPDLNLVDTLLVLVAAVVALFVCSLAAGVVLAIVRGPRAIALLSSKDPAVVAMLLIPAQIAAYALTVGFMVFYVREKYHVGFLRAVRWNKPAGNLVWYALAGGSVLAFASAMAESLLRRWIPKSLPIEQLFSTPRSAYLLAAFGVLVAPLVEELFFRGFLYSGLAKGLSRVFAWRGFLELGRARQTGIVFSVVLTAALFALLHAGQLALSWAALLVIFMVGTVLTVIRARTNSLSTCVLVHAGYNFTLFAMLFFATGHFHHMEKM